MALSIASVREQLLNDEDAYWLDDHDFTNPVNPRNESASLSLILSQYGCDNQSVIELCDSYCKRMGMADEKEPGRPFPSSSNESKLMQWAQDKGMDTMVEPASWGADGLRGLMATTEIKPGSVVISMPYDLLINYESIWASDLGRVRQRIPGLGEEAAALIWTMVDRYDTDSPFIPFWSSLPPSFGTGLSIGRVAIDQIHPECSLRMDIEVAQRHLKEQYDSLQSVFTALCQAYPTFIQPSLFTWQSFLWAAELWYAYSITCLLPSDKEGNKEGNTVGEEGKREPCLVPFVSLMNHNPMAPHIVHFSKIDPVTRRLNLMAFRSCTIGSQVFLSYGALPNSKLLTFYGFVPSCNPFDFVPLSKLNCSQDKDTGDLRMNLLKMGNIDLGIQKIKMPLGLSQGGLNQRLPFELKACLRLLTATRAELVQLEAKCGGGGRGGGKKPKAGDNALRRDKREALRRELRGELSIETELAALGLLHSELSSLKTSLTESSLHKPRNEGDGEMEGDSSFVVISHFEQWRTGQLEAINWGLEISKLN